jgi:hypothetical protein
MYKVESVEHHFNNKNIDVVSNSEEEETKESSEDSFPLSDWGMGNSPYENRIFDWIVELQNGYSDKEKELERDCKSTHEYNPQQEYDTWDYSGILWDL